MKIDGTIVRRVNEIPKQFEYIGTHLIRKGFLSLYAFWVDNIHRRLELMHRGHAVAILLIDATAREVVMIQQPRQVKAFAENALAIDALERAKMLGVGSVNMQSFMVDAEDVTVFELCAGMIEGNDTPVETAVRELQEETGFLIRPDQLEVVQEYYPSIGGTTERITAFFGMMEPNQPQGETRGDGSEQIVVWRMSFGEAFRLMRDGHIPSASSLILLRELQIRVLMGKI